MKICLGFEEMRRRFDALKAEFPQLHDPKFGAICHAIRTISLDAGHIDSLANDRLCVLAALLVAR